VFTHEKTPPGRYGLQGESMTMHVPSQFYMLYLCPRQTGEVMRRTPY
jgi:hypothetical protein